MRISLHIVVAQLLIALIYCEILKGILPPLCGNNWQAMLSARYWYCLLLSKQTYLAYISMFCY